MQSLSKLALLSSAIFTLSGCSKNLFADLSDKGSRAYKLDTAREALNVAAFDSAIATVRPVWDANNRDIEAASILSQAFAGRAGLRVLDLFEVLGSELGAKTAFTIFAEHFALQTLTPEDLDDMEAAVSVIEQVGDTPELRADQSFNFFALFAYYGRIGAILRFHAYDDSGTLIPTWTACSDTDLPDLQVDHIMPSVPRIQEIIDYLPNAGSFTGSGLPTFPRIPIGCPATGSGLGEAYCWAARTMVNDSTVGLGNNDVCP